MRMTVATSTTSARILVCQAGSCKRKGSEAVLLEIEELVKHVSIDSPNSSNNNGVGNVDGRQETRQCNVEESGCLGLCRQAPSAVVLRKSPQCRRRRYQLVVEEEKEKELYFTHLDSLTDSVKVVTEATGKIPRTDRPGLQNRLAGARCVRRRNHAISVYRWNEAMQAIQDQLDAAIEADPSTQGNYQELVQDYQRLLSKIGYSPPPIRNVNGDLINTPTSIDQYTKWSLTAIDVVSNHSAIFHFKSNDLKRGTPNPRGGGRQLPTPKTWHTTLLAQVGPNEEGPLPWIERDYTPISCAKEWEQGTCRILIKIYLAWGQKEEADGQGGGAATSWMHRELVNNALPLEVWLSKPIPTLQVPTLIKENGGFKPASVLLLLAGTGVVALPQVLDHRDPYNKIGISTKQSNQLHVPVDLIVSFRKDDVLMVPEITELCRQAMDHDKQFQTTTNDQGGNSSRRGAVGEGAKGIRNCTLLLTPPADGIGNRQTPFPDFDSSSPSCLLSNDRKRKDDELVEELGHLLNARVLQDTRLNLELVSEAMLRMPMPCRVLVSGPSNFNSAVRSMLLNANVDDDSITILEA